MKATAKKGSVPEFTIVKTIEGIEFTQCEVSSLNHHEQNALHYAATKKNLLDRCSNDIGELSNLMPLALRKIVPTLSDDEKIISYSKNANRSILHLAAATGDSSLISELLGFNAFEMGKFCNSIPKTEHKRLVAGIINNILGDALTSKIDTNKPVFDGQLIGEAILNKFAAEDNPLNAFIIKFKSSMGDNYKDLPYEQCFVQHTALVDTLDKEDFRGQTPIHLAIRKGHIEAIDEMLKHKKGRNALSLTNNLGNNILHLVLLEGSTAMLAKILEYPEARAVLSRPNNKGFTPLDYALLSSTREVSLLLIENGAVPDLNMLFNNTFSSEINKKLRANYYNYLSATAHNTVNTAVEFLSNAIAVSALSNYMNEHKREVEEQGRY